MPAPLTTDLVWKVIEKEIFAVIGMVTTRGEARTVGIVYVVRGRKLYIGSETDSWKVRHIAANPHVSVTIAIPKRIPLMPWIKIPAATITFAGTARVLPAGDASHDILAAVYRHVAADPEAMARSSVIEVTPEKEFLTYGIGIPLMQMRFPDKARGRAPVA